MLLQTICKTIFSMIKISIIQMKFWNSITFLAGKKGIHKKAGL